MNIKKTFAIFISIICASIASFALLWGINPITEKETAMSSQGIRLVGSTTIYSNENKFIIKVGDIILSNNGKIFKIHELRRIHSGTIYIIVASKKLSDYSDYIAYQKAPYISNNQTYELKSFIVDKKIIDENEIIKYYNKYKRQLDKISELQRKQALIAPQSYHQQLNSANVPVELIEDQYIEDSIEID